MYCIFQLIVLFAAFLFLSIDSKFIRIGNYSQLNPKNCGFSRTSLKTDTNCFEYHKDIIPPLTRSKNVTIGESPWVTLLFITTFNKTANNTNTWACSGAVIADQWILTAAHCLDGSVQLVRIYMGYNFTLNKPNPGNNFQNYFQSTETFVHPRYSSTYSTHDLGLIKMNKPVNSSSNGIYAELNSICLPEKWDGVYDPETWQYAMMSGWGPGYVVSDNTLQISYWQMKNVRDYPGQRGESSFFMFPLDDQGVCSGDSGGPVWQYYMGRAVLIGVHSARTRISPDSGCMPANDISQRGVNMWVDQEIDWIKNVTQLN